MQGLVIFGASNFGDEIAQLFRDVNSASPRWELLGYLDDDERSWGSERFELPVLGGAGWLASAPAGVHVAVAIGNPPARKRVVRQLEGMGARFASAVHPTVVSSPHNDVGPGSLVTAGCILTVGVELGRHVIVNLACTIGHRTRIGDFSTLNPMIAVSGDVIFEEGVYVGTGAAVNDKLTIGRGAIIGSGGVVVRDVPAFATAVGVPAKVVKTRDDDLGGSE